MQLFSGFPSKFSFLLELFGITEELTDRASSVADPLATICPILREVKVLERANLIHVVLNLLDASRRPILDQVLHRMQGLVDSAPLFRGTIQLLPEVSHYLCVVVPTRRNWLEPIFLPIERMIGEHLQLGVGNVPIFVGGALFEHLLVLHHVVHFVFTT